MDEPEGSQRHAQPHGDGVCDAGGVEHHQQEGHPADGEALGSLDRRDRRAIEVGGEGDVGHHGQHVRHSQPGQQQVGGTAHVLAHEDADDDDIADDAGHTHHQAGVAVDVGVVLVEAA